MTSSLQRRQLSNVQGMSKIWKFAAMLVGAFCGIYSIISTLVGSKGHKQVVKAPESPVQEKHRKVTQKPLLNIVVSGDKGVGKTTMSHFLAGRECSTPRPTANADFLLHEALVGDQLGTIAMWHLGGREEVSKLDPSFYCLSSAAIVVYSPLTRGIVETLNYWTCMCGNGNFQGVTRPIMVVASMPAESLTKAAANKAKTNVRLAEQWCSQHGMLHARYYHPGDGVQENCRRSHVGMVEYEAKLYDNRNLTQTYSHFLRAAAAYQTRQDANAWKIATCKVK